MYVTKMGLSNKWFYEYYTLCEYMSEDFVLIDEKLKTLYNHLLTLNELIPESPIDNREQYGRTLTVILSQICNMSCTYCYATAAHSNKVLSIEKFKTFINWCYENGRDEIEKIVFIGGGEPMATWCLLKESILYLKKKYINTSCSIITNASLIDEEKCDFRAKLESSFYSSLV